MTNYIIRNQPSFCDWGCALGDGTDYLRKSLFLESITGIDFSDSSIETAKKSFPASTFICANLVQEPFDQKFDIIFSSNTLEHFYTPWQTLRAIAKFAKEHLIVLIPFQEYVYPCKEHFYTFDYQNIPVIIDDFTLSFGKAIDVYDSENWPGKQILLIYSSRSCLKNFFLGDIFIEGNDFDKVRYSESFTVLSQNIEGLNAQLLNSEQLNENTSLLVKTLEEEKASLSKRLLENVSQLANANVRISELEQQKQDIERINNEFSLAQKDIASLNEENGLLRTLATDLKGQLQVTEVQSLKTREYVTLLENENKELKVDSSQLFIVQKETQDLKISIENLVAVKQETDFLQQAQLSDAHSRIAELEQQKQDFEGNIMLANKRIEDLEIAASQHTDKEIQKQYTIAQLTDSLKEKENILNGLLEDKNKFLREVEELSKLFLESDLKAKLELEEQAVIINRLKEEINSLFTKLESVGSENILLFEQLSSVQDMFTSLLKEKSKLLETIDEHKRLYTDIAHSNSWKYTKQLRLMVYKTKKLFGQKLD
ncbi:MAG: Methyltransferase type 11 [Flaviaesturariibacter sp.]|nr:Methyltransferase type 11 [Flaviaesturariibacter sp.]